MSSLSHAQRARRAALVGATILAGCATPLLAQTAPDPAQTQAGTPPAEQAQPQAAPGDTPSTRFAGAAHAYDPIPETRVAASGPRTQRAD